MLKLSRGLVCILVSTLIIGCSANLEKVADKKEDGEVEYSLMGRAVYSPAALYAGIDNPIEIKDIQVKNTESQQFNYIQISGLQDKAVEAKINEDIKALFDQMLPYAEFKKAMPFRGAQTLMQEDTKVSGAHLTISSTFNSNNVLSVVAYVAVNLETQKYGYKYMNMDEGLNFDLNTGEQFSLEDVFVNDIDPWEIINSVIAENINGYKTAFSIGEFDYYGLVAPFKGIKHGQRFYLTNNGVNVIINYNNPEFDIGFNTRVIEVPYSACRGSIAIAERFYEEGINIYTSGATEKRLFGSYSSKRKYEYSSLEKDNARWEVNISYPEDLEETLVEQIKAFRAEQEAFVLDSVIAESLNYVEQRIYVYQAGRYLNISCHVYFSNGNEGLWKEDSYVYSETGQQLELEDIFAADYDYMPILIDGLEKAIREYNLPVSPEKEKLLPGMGFTINDTGITFVTKTYEWSPGNKHPLSFQIQYKDIGYDNLLVF